MYTLAQMNMLRKYYINIKCYKRENTEKTTVINTFCNENEIFLLQNV